MRKEMRICKCGRIHLIPEEKIEKAINDGKEFLYICSGCGKAVAIGAHDIGGDFPIMSRYSRELNDFEDVVIESDKYSEILYSCGIPVPMKTGNDANACFDGHFSDMIYPDFYKIQRSDITVFEIMNFIDTYNEERCTVDMERLIRDNEDEDLKIISGYAVSGFNWNGTKYEK